MSELHTRDCISKGCLKAMKKSRRYAEKIWRMCGFEFVRKSLLSKAVGWSRKSPRFKSKELLSGSPGASCAITAVEGNPPKLVSGKGTCVGRYLWAAGAGLAQERVLGMNRLFPSSRSLCRVNSLTCSLPGAQCPGEQGKHLCPLLPPKSQPAL